MSCKQVKNDLQMSDGEIALNVRNPTGAQGLAIVAKHNIGNKAMVRKAYELLNPKSHSILEIGFGNGVHFSEVLQHFPDAVLTGLELSPTMVDDCLKINASLIDANRLRVQTGDIQQFQMACMRFDAVITVNTIYYWGDTQRCLQNIFDLLRPGGQLVIAIRPESNIKNISYIRYGIERLGFRLYSTPEIIYLLETAGFVYINDMEFQDGMSLTDKDGQVVTLRSCYISVIKPY